jgi:hypothetical protein
MEKELQEKVESFRAEVTTLKEPELFLYIEGFGSCSFDERHWFAHGKMDVSEETLKENQNYYQEMQNIALKEVIRSYRVHHQPSEKCVQLSVFPDIPPKVPEWNYRKWYRFWKNWMEYFSDTEWDIISYKMKQKEDISEYLPLVKWDEVKEFSSDCMRSVMVWPY